MPNGSNELYHSGRKGMKWGTRNGPPYPLSRQARFKEGFESYNKNLKPKGASSVGSQVIRDPDGVSRVIKGGTRKRITRKDISRARDQLIAEGKLENTKVSKRRDWEHARVTQKEITEARKKAVELGYLEPPKQKPAIRNRFAAKRASKDLNKYERLRSIYKGKMRDAEIFTDFAKGMTDNVMGELFKQQGAMSYANAKLKYSDYSQKIDKILKDLKESGYDVNSEEVFRDSRKGREKPYNNALEWEKMSNNSKLAGHNVASNKYTVKRNKNYTLRGKASNALDNITPVANRRLENKLQKVAKSQYRSQRNMRFKDDPQRFVDRINADRPEGAKYKDYLDYTRKTAKTPKLAKTLSRRYKYSQASSNLAVQTNAKKQRADEEDLKNYVSSLKGKGYELSTSKVKRDPYENGRVTKEKHYDYMGRPTDMDSMRIIAKKKKKKKS